MSPFATIRQGYRLRVYPTRAQRRLLGQYVGCARWVWNWGLDTRRTAWAERKESLSDADLCKRLPALYAERPWLAGPPASALQQSLRIREDCAHKLTAEFVKTFEAMGIEDLNVQGMSASAKGAVESPGKNVRQKAGLNRAVLDACPGRLHAQLQYKAERYGRTLVAADRFEATSKTCSACGAKKTELALSERRWTCGACGATHDRGVNAGKNIERVALDMLGWPSGQPAQPSARRPENCTPLAATSAAPARTPGKADDTTSEARSGRANCRVLLSTRRTAPRAPLPVKTRRPRAYRAGRLPPRTFRRSRPGGR